MTLTLFSATLALAMPGDQPNLRPAIENPPPINKSNEATKKTDEVDLVYDFQAGNFKKKPRSFKFRRGALAAVTNMNRLRYRATILGTVVAAGSTPPELLANAGLAPKVGGGGESQGKVLREREPLLKDARKALTAVRDVLNLSEEIYHRLYTANTKAEAADKLAPIRVVGLTGPRIKAEVVKETRTSYSIFEDDLNGSQGAMAELNTKGLDPNGLGRLYEVEVARLQSTQRELRAYASKPQERANVNPADGQGGQEDPGVPNAPGKGGVDTTPPVPAKSQAPAPDEKEKKEKEQKEREEKEVDTLILEIASLIGDDALDANTAKVERAQGAWMAYGTEVPGWPGSSRLFDSELYQIDTNGDVAEVKFEVFQIAPEVPPAIKLQPTTGFLGGGEKAEGGQGKAAEQPTPPSPPDEKAVTTKTARLNIDIPFGTIKTDYSVGLTYAALADEMVRTEPTKEEGKTHRAAIRMGEGGLRPSAFIHFNFYRDSKIGLNAQIGAAIKDEKTFGYLAGGGISFGYEQRLMLNFGVMFQNVDRSNVREDTDLYSTSDLTRSTTLSRLYIGVSYAFK